MVMFEPLSTTMLDENPMFKDSFRQVGCLRFCQKLEGFHVQVARDFALNYDGIKSKVGPLEITISPDSIAQATKIPRFGEQWFKSMKFQLVNCDDFLKEGHKGVDLIDGIPKTWLLELFEHFLSLGKMADKVQAKSQIADKYVFHFCLIKLLVLEELKRTNKDWNTFIFLANYDLEVMSTLSRKVSFASKPQVTPIESSRKKKGRKEIVKGKDT